MLKLFNVNAIGKHQVKKRTIWVDDFPSIFYIWSENNNKSKSVYLVQRYLYSQLLRLNIQIHSFTKTTY